MSAIKDLKKLLFGWHDHAKYNVDIYGRPHKDDDWHLFSELPEGEKKLVLLWAKIFFRPYERILYARTSYMMKQDVYRAFGIYMTDNQFRDMMLGRGFYPVDKNTSKWIFNLNKYPAFASEALGMYGRVPFQVPEQISDDVLLEIGQVLEDYRSKFRLADYNVVTGDNIVLAMKTGVQLADIAVRNNWKPINEED